MPAPLSVIPGGSRLPTPRPRRGNADMPILRGDIRSEMLRSLIAYWDALRGERAMPARADLRPEEMGFALGRIMLVEIHEQAPAGSDQPGPTFRFHLVGTKIEAAGHGKLTGRWAHELEPPFYRELVLRAYREAALSGLPSLRRIASGDGTYLLRYERAALPLAADGRHPDMLLVGIDWEPVNNRFLQIYPAIRP
jgi:hypothetical protein